LCPSPVVPRARERDFFIDNLLVREGAAPRARLVPSLSSRPNTKGTRWRCWPWSLSSAAASVTPVACRIRIVLRHGWLAPRPLSLSRPVSPSNVEFMVRGSESGTPSFPRPWRSQRAPACARRQSCRSWLPPLTPRPVLLSDVEFMVQGSAFWVLALEFCVQGLGTCFPSPPATGQI